MNKKGDYGGLICSNCGLEHLSLDQDGLCELCSWWKSNLDEPYTVIEDPIWPGPPLCPDLPHSSDCKCSMCRGD